MRNIIIGSLLVFASCSGCKKNDPVADFENRTILGTWYSPKANLQYAITHRDGIGKATDQMFFKEYTSNGGKKMLDVMSKSDTIIYQIKWLGKKELFLIDTKDPDQKDIAFTRVD